MADDVSHTKFLGEVKIVSKMDIISYEVWINGKHFKNTETYAMALCWLSDYLHQITSEETTKQIINSKANLYAKN